MRAAVSRVVCRVCRVFVGTAEHQGEHLGDVVRVGREHGGVLLEAVVGLVGQSDPGLAEVRQIAAGVFGIGVDVESDAAAHPGALQGAEDRRERAAIGGVVDDRQFVVQRLQAAAFDGVLIDEARVEITDALLVGARRGPTAGLPPG